MGATVSVSIIYVSKQLNLGRGLGRSTYIAMLGEALGASYGNIAIVVAAALLRRLSPLLRIHDVRFVEVMMPSWQC